MIVVPVAGVVVHRRLHPVHRPHTCHSVCICAVVSVRLRLHTGCCGVVASRVRERIAVRRRHLVHISRARWLFRYNRIHCPLPERFTPTTQLTTPPCCHHPPPP